MKGFSAAGCTIVARNYLAQARVLAKSFHTHHPDVPFFVLLADEPFNPPLGDDEPFELVLISDLHIPHLTSLCFQYNLKELNTAVKPTFLRYLFIQKQCKNVLFIDPDVLVLSSLDPLFRTLESASVILTPHITEPIPDGIRPTETAVLLVGTYNLGFMGLRATDRTLAFIDWWEDRLREGCREDKEHGYFVDQKWADLLPAFVDDVAIIRDTAYNIAYWNLHERSISHTNNRYFVNGKPIGFFHFSGYLPEKPDVLTSYVTTHALQDNQDLRHLHDWYAQLLKKEGYDTLRQLPYAFDTYADGSPIPPAARLLYLQEKLQKRFPSPFDSNEQSYQRFYKRSLATSDGSKRSLAAESIGLNRSLLAKRHTWEPYQRLCRFLRRMMGSRAFLFLRRIVRGERSTRDPARKTDRFARRDFGVNVSGYLKTTMGLGQAVRGYIRAFEAAGIPISTRSCDHATQGREGTPQQILPYAQEPYAFNFIHVNADQVSLFASEVGADYFRSRYSIGYWVWEVTTFPQALISAFSCLQEVWTASTFTQRILAPIAPLPVQVIPHVVEVRSHHQRTRRDFGLPEDRFLFLFIFDFFSIFERKNPLAILEAFRRAFPDNAHATVVVKTIHGDKFPQETTLLREALAGIPHVHIDAILPRDATEDLMHCCDAYISLHRSEGFGLTLAEAMLMGKPVIATAYGGNTDFMTPNNSFLVRSAPVALSQDYGPYPAGAFWAEPDIDEAALHMRTVLHDRSQAAARGVRAREAIATAYAPTAIGALMRKRLEILRDYY